MAGGNQVSGGGGKTDKPVYVTRRGAEKIVPGGILRDKWGNVSGLPQVLERGREDFNYQEMSLYKRKPE